jgi:hypothetical protein
VLLSPSIALLQLSGCTVVAMSTCRITRRCRVFSISQSSVALAPHRYPPPAPAFSLTRRPLTLPGIDARTRAELTAFVKERVVPFVGVQPEGLPDLPLAPTGSLVHAPPLSPVVRRSFSPLRRALRG